MRTASPELKRQLGLSAVLAVVVGDMIGSGIFFTPGELAAVAKAEWQVYFVWSLCGIVTLCGALTLAEIASLLPSAGASYHALNRAFGPAFGFVQAWTMILVSGPGAIAGLAILFGELAVRMTGGGSGSLWGVAAIATFCAINLAGVAWGGRTQIVLTLIKLGGLGALIGGALLLAEPAAVASEPAALDGDWWSAISVLGLGVGVVLFTYDGWIDASNVAGEVREPNRVFPLALGIGVLLITAVYLLVNFAFLRVVPLEAMRAEPTLVAVHVAQAAFGPSGGAVLDTFIWISIAGALGGLTLTLPRLYFAAANEYVERASRVGLGRPFRAIAHLSRRKVPAGAIIVGSVMAVAALLTFGSFSRIVSFFVVPFQVVNILMVASLLRLRPMLATAQTYRSPWFPLLPWVFIVVMTGFVMVSFVYNPFESMVGSALALLGVPLYLRLSRNAA